MTDVDGPKFACAACGREFRWKPELAGKKAKCKCGAMVTVPTAPPAPAAVENDAFDDDADLPEPITSRGGARAAYGAPPPPPPIYEPQQPQQIGCPVCNTPAPPTAVLCTHCGYNFRTGVRMPGAGRGQALAYATKGAHTGGISADTYAQAAKAAWMAPLIAFTLGCCTRGAIRGAPAVGFVIAGFQLLLILGGLGLGVFALTGVRKHGSTGILAPAIVGIILNVGIIALNVVLVILLTSGKLLPPAPPGGGPMPPPRTVPVVPRSR
jgi:hypothetical protein